MALAEGETITTTQANLFNVISVTHTQEKKTVAAVKSNTAYTNTKLH